MKNSRRLCFFFFFFFILQEGVGTEVIEYKTRKIMKNWSREPFQTKADQRGPGKIIYSCEQRNHHLRLPRTFLNLVMVKEI